MPNNKPPLLKESMLFLSGFLIAATVFSLLKDKKKTNTANFQTSEKKTTTTQALVDRKSRNQISANSKNLTELSEVLNRDSNLTPDEFEQKLLQACLKLNNADLSQLKEAVLLLPPGQKSYGAFNTLLFYMFEKDPEASAFFLDDLRSDGSFPVDWTISAIENGIGSLSKTDPLKAIDIATKSSSTEKNPIEQARLIAAALKSPASLDASAAINSALSSSLKDPKIAEHLLEESGFWDYLVKSNGVETIITSTQANKTDLTKYAKEALAQSLSSHTDFNSGLSLITSNLKGDKNTISIFIGDWLTRDPNTAITGMTNLDQETKDIVISNNISRIYTWDKSAAKQWADTIQNNELRKRANEKIK